jgi:hypothetical protein
MLKLALAKIEFRVSSFCGACDGAECCPFEYRVLSDLGQCLLRLVVCDCTLRPWISADADIAPDGDESLDDTGIFLAENGGR